MVLGETIAAIATAPGRGGVAVVRVSGSESFGIAERLTGHRVREAGMSVRKVYSRSDSSSLIPDRSSLIDEAVVLSFRSPRSYTGEDVVEFQCHGGAVTPRRVLAACLAAGARLARRGEFTERAFLHGRLDYDQARSVLDLIDAKTDRAADAALAGLAGRRRRELKELYDAALGLSARLEYALDVDDGELPRDFRPSVAAAVAGLAAALDAALRRAREGRILRDGALVVLAGPPNAGKSSLMNALLEENRVLVSDVPGTTRDSVEAWLDLDGWPIRLVDTAGLRAADDAVERAGVQRARELVARADVVVALTGADAPAAACEPPAPGAGVPVLRVRSKCDLGRGPGLNVSAKTGEGLDGLRRAIVAQLEARAPQADAGACDEDAAALQGARAELAQAGADDLVLIANGVRAAAERLGARTGATYSRDLLDNLFSRFCVGK